MGGDRKTDLLVSWNFFAIGGVGSTGKGESIESVEFGWHQGQGGGIDDHPATAVGLYQGPAALRILFSLCQTERGGESILVSADLLKTREVYGIVRGNCCQISAAAQVVNLRWQLAGRGPSRHLKKSILSHPVNQEIGFAVEED